MSRAHRLLILLILLTIGLLLAAVFFAALPALVRALPGRYAYYMPEPLQQWRQVDHPDLLPTPAATLPPAPTPIPSPTPTVLPTLQPTPLPSPTPRPTLPAAHTLAGLRHEPQGWNNCGPATLAMALSYWGRSETQRELAPILKPDPEDKNVSPHEMADAVQEIGLQALVRVGGDLERLKRLLAAGFPVIVETWYVRDARDQLGHYRLLVGYDDAAEQFITYDSLHGPDLPIGYQELDELWRVFDRVYVVPYPAEREGQLAAVLGADWDEATAIAGALETARQEALEPPLSCVAYADCADAETFAWFDVGSNLLLLGQYEEAAAAYDRARVLGLHWRMLWYQFGPYEAYYAAGRYEDVIALANATLATTSNLEESYYWRGMALWGQGDVAAARADFETALHYHEDWSPAAEALAAIEE
ncbi:MAG: C39 family peptidase [Anaerolineae bacterium]|nr:C39 family peptidase [Anaerolineae bacterium]